MFKDLLFKNTTVRQTVFKNTSWLFIGEVIGRVIRFSIVIYAARLLGAAEYGAFSYALSIAAFLTIFSDLGISPVITKEASRGTAGNERRLSTALLLKSLLVLINAAFLFFALPIISQLPEAIALFPLLFFVFAFDSFRELGFALSRAMETMEREAYAKIILNAAVAGLGFTFLAFSPTAESLMWAYVVGTGVGLAATVLLLRQSFRVFGSRASLADMWAMFKEALPIGLLGILGAIAINTDMIMIGWWKSAEHVGYYAAAQKIVLLLYVMPTLLSSAAFPVFSRLAKTDPTYFRVIFEKLLTAAALLAFPMAIGGILTAPALIELLYGASYAPAVLTLQILFATLLIVFPCTILPNALFAFDRQKNFLLFTAIGAIGNMLLNWLLIPRYGIEGAAMATVIAQLVANSFIWSRMQRTNPFRFFGHLPRILLATLVMAAIIVFVQQFELPVLAVIGIGAAVYGAALWLTHEPTLREIKSVYTAKSASPEQPSA